MNYYEILGIASNADQHEIKRAFRKKALQFHPDRNNDAASNEQFHLVYIAYDVLQDPLKRGIYDLMQQVKQKAKDEPGNENNYYYTSYNGQAENASQRRAYEEREQRRRAYYKRQEYTNAGPEPQITEEDNDFSSRVQFHSNQGVGFFFCFMLLCVGFTSLLFGYMFVTWEQFNGAMLLGCTFWAVGGTLSVVAGKGLMAVFQTWKT